MEEKGLLFVIVLALAVLAVFGYLGIQAYKSLNTVPSPAESEPATSSVSAPTKRGAPAPPDHLASGRAFYDQGNYAASVDSYRKAQAAHPENPAIKNLIAGAEAMLRVQTAMLGRKWDEALAACQDAAKYSISAQDAQRRMAEVGEFRNYYESYDRGRVAAEKGDFKKAEQEYLEAWRVASRMNITSDAKQRIDEIRGRGQAADSVQKDSEWVLEVCAQRNDPYGTYAALSYFISSDMYKPRQAAFKNQLEATKSFIDGNRAKFPALRSTATIHYDVVHKQNGDVLRGQIVDKDDKVVRLRQEKDGKTMTRTILAGEVTQIGQEIIKPDGINEKKAEEVLAQAVTELANKRPYKALSLLGMLKCEFPGVPLMTDTEKQQNIISTASMGTALQGGPTIEKLAAACVTRCQSVCAKCEGATVIACPECNGQGEKQVTCLTCNGLGKTTCTACNGVGKVPGLTPGTLVKCPTCMGRGSFTCPECKGKKTFNQPCAVCNGRKTAPCDVCGGNGQRPGGN